MDRLERVYVELLRTFQPHQAVAPFIALASRFRDADRHLAAALVSLAGHRFGRRADSSFALLGDATNDLLLYLDRNPGTSWEKLLALRIVADNCSSFLLAPVTAVALEPIRRCALGQYYDMLWQLADCSQHADALLIYGFEIEGFLDSDWTVVTTTHKVAVGDHSGLQFWSRSVRQKYQMTGGFRVLLELADYDGASKLSRTREHALISPGLRAWSLASEGLSTDTPEFLEDAAAQFESDSCDRPGRNPAEPWSSINQTVWSPYFRSRSQMGKAFSSPHDAFGHLQGAAASLPWHMDWVVPEVIAYHHVIRSLTALGEGDTAAIAAILASYRREATFFSGWSATRHAEEFLVAVDSFAQVRTEDHWLPHLSQLLRVLDRVPMIGLSERVTLQNALSVIVPASLEGVGNGWEYRALEKIRDERQLHRILLALFRAEAAAPLYSQIRHGPLEYGKDIVVLRQEDGARVLWMYSVKIGPIKKANWNKEVRPQLEEMFQVPLDSTGLPDNVDERVGVLVWNDHIRPYADPIINGWLRDQNSVYGRRFEFMNIDRLVGHIVNNKLAPILRKALRAEGLLQ